GGDRIDVRVTAHDVLFAGHTAELVVVSDITERERAGIDLEAALEANRRLTLHDPLTGLPNRAGFNERVRDAIGVPQAAPLGVAVLVLGLDRFKEINDSLGHASGDQLLTEVADRLRSAFRAGDTVGRMGGDEFGVLLGGAENASELAADAVQRIERALEPPFLLQDLPVVVDGSVGIALHPEHGADADALLRAAGLAMDGAKREGQTSA